MSNVKRVYVLTYHAQNITGTTYASNDHIALANDLPLIRRLGFQCVSALRLAQALRRNAFARLPDRCVVLTLDDGSVFDHADIVHPTHGPQRSMLNILRGQHRRRLGWRFGRAPFTATSFVIGCPSARRQICGSMADPDWMTDSWWAAAQRSGYLDIACHSWDHVHPCVAEMARNPDIVGAFHLIDSPHEADRQIADAARRLRAVTRSDAAGLFAYPFGQTSDYLVREYLPRQDAVIAAFTIAGEPVTKHTGIWQIPRFVCGDHWRSPADLEALLCRS